MAHKLLHIPLAWSYICLVSAQREVILESLSKILSTAACIGFKETEKKNGLLENQVCNFGVGVELATESCSVHLPPAPIRGHAIEWNI